MRRTERVCVNVDGKVQHKKRLSITDICILNYDRYFLLNLNYEAQCKSQTPITKNIIISHTK